MSGSVWRFSNRIVDEDLKILERDFITYYEGADYYRLGLKVFTRMAHEAGAVYKIGKMVRVKREIFDAYLRRLDENEDMTDKAHHDMRSENHNEMA